MWLFIDERYRDVLNRAGLRAVADFMAFSRGDVVKRLPTKTIVRLELESPTGRRRYFLKRHAGPVRWRERLRALCSGFSPSWGRKEWEVIRAFERSGIPTMTPVAAGERRCGRGYESFVMTEELTGFRSLETLVPARYAPPLDAAAIAEKRAMIRRVADLTRRLHGAGFNHRDWYLCHIFTRQAEDGTWPLRVLDLQRVDRRRWLRRRWIVKDLAALNYSAPPGVVTIRDRARFLKAYLDDGRALGEHRALIRAIVRKTARIRRHDARLQRNRRSSQAAAASPAT
ncbi:MAG: lipopolysaccharide kinase InaA family protein [Nitrospirota bacterium]